MFITFVHENKAFAAEQKIGELKTRISKLKAQKPKNLSNKGNFKFC